MEDKYLKIRYPISISRDGTWIDFFNALPKQKGILYCIEYSGFIAYGISVENSGMKYHRLDGPAIVYKNEEYDKPNEYWVYSKLLGYAGNITFEEFKIKRDKLLKEMVFT